SQETLDLALIKGFANLDEAVSRFFGLSENEKEELDANVGELIEKYPSDGEFNNDNLRACYLEDIPALVERVQKERGSSRFVSKKAYVSSRRLELASRLLRVHPDRVVQARGTDQLIPPNMLGEAAIDAISYGVGASYGRWDVRLLTGERQEPALPD